MKKVAGAFACDSIGLENIQATYIEVIGDASLRGGVEIESTFENQREFDDIMVIEGRELVLRGKNSHQTITRTHSSTVARGDVVAGQVINGDLVGGRIITNARQPGFFSRLFRFGQETGNSIDQKDIDLIEMSLRMSIRVPIGFAVRLRGCGVTEYLVNGVEGPLNAHLSGNCSLRSGFVLGAHLDLNGVGRVEIQSIGMGLECEVGGGATAKIGNIRGRANLTLKGTSRVDIQSSEGELECDVSGSSKAAFNDVCGDQISWKLSGSARVKASSAKADNMWCSLHGNADMDIKGGQIGSLNATLSGNSKMSCDASVETADLGASGNAAIELSDIRQNLNQNVSGNGRVRVKGGSPRRTGDGKPSKGKFPF